MVTIPQNSKFDEEVAGKSDFSRSAPRTKIQHVIFILDRSGSMSGKEADVIGGFNTFVKDIKDHPVEGTDVGLTFVRFDTEIELVWNDKAIDGVPTMTPQLYQPRGNTALLDAVGITLNSIKNNPDHTYLVNIHTDGLENASTEWTKERVKEVIQGLEAKGNWTFTFFGTDLNNFSDAGGMGIGASNTIMYAAADSGSNYASNARVSRVMRTANINSSASYGQTVGAVMGNENMTDEEIEKMLTESNTSDSTEK